MEAVVCKGGKGISTWRQGGGGEAGEHSSYRGAARPTARYLGDPGAVWLRRGLAQALEALSRMWTHRLPTPTPTEARTLPADLTLWAANCVADRRGSFPALLEPQRTEPRASAGNSEGGQGVGKNFSRAHSSQAAPAPQSWGVLNGPASLNQVSWEAPKMEKPSGSSFQNPQDRS